MSNKYVLNVFNTCSGHYEDVEVPEEIYREFQRANWRDEKRERAFLKHQIQFSEIFDDAHYEVEDISESVEQILDANNLREKIKEALTEAEFEVIDLIIWKQLTEREYAALKGIPQVTVNYRKKSALKKIEKIFEKCCSKSV